MCWWEAIFNNERIYNLLEGGPSRELAAREVDFVSDLIKVRPGMTVLDAGCGRGWLAFGLSDRGAKVTAIDTSSLMARYVGSEIGEHPGVTFRQMDLKDVAATEPFDAVVCWGVVLGNTERQQDREAISVLAGALKPGGMLVVELHNSDWYRRNALGRRWWETEEYYILDHSSYDETKGRLTIRNVIIPRVGGRPEEYEYRLLHYQPAEAMELLRSAGIVDTQLYGDGDAADTGPLFSTTGWNDQSHVMILAGRKVGWSSAALDSGVA